MYLPSWISIALGIAMSASAATLSTRQMPERNYVLVFGGSSNRAGDRDASLVGPQFAYQGFIYLPDDTYNVAACQRYCDSVRNCVFFNVYYEYFGTASPDATNLKCAVYNQVLGVDTKQNWGGAQVLPPPAPPSEIRQSTGWGNALVTPPATEGPTTPTQVYGFEVVFDEPAGMTASEGIMNTINMVNYDTAGCANFCLSQEPLPGFGDCKFFNIVTIKSSGKAQATMCRLYAKDLNRDTLNTPPSGTVTFERTRGYRRVVGFARNS